jgi:hypothetical protein
MSALEELEKYISVQEGGDLFKLAARKLNNNPMLSSSSVKAAASSNLNDEVDNFIDNLRNSQRLRKKQFDQVKRLMLMDFLFVDDLESSLTGGDWEGDSDPIIVPSSLLTDNAESFLGDRGGGGCSSSRDSENDSADDDSLDEERLKGPRYKRQDDDNSPQRILESLKAHTSFSGIDPASSLNKVQKHDKRLQSPTVKTSKSKMRVVPTKESLLRQIDQSLEFLRPPVRRSATEEEMEEQVRRANELALRKSEQIQHGRPPTWTEGKGRHTSIERGISDDSHYQQQQHQQQQQQRISSDHRHHLQQLNEALGVNSDEESDGYDDPDHYMDDDFRKSDEIFLTRAVNARILHDETKTQLPTIKSLSYRTGKHKDNRSARDIIQDFIYHDGGVGPIFHPSSSLSSSADKEEKPDTEPFDERAIRGSTTLRDHMIREETSRVVNYNISPRGHITTDERTQKMSIPEHGYDDAIHGGYNGDQEDALLKPAPTLYSNSQVSAMYIASHNYRDQYTMPNSTEIPFESSPAVHGHRNVENEDDERYYRADTYQWPSSATTGRGNIRSIGDGDLSSVHYQSGLMSPFPTSSARVVADSELFTPDVPLISREDEEMARQQEDVGGFRSDPQESIEPAHVPYRRHSFDPLEAEVHYRPPVSSQDVNYEYDLRRSDPEVGWI